MAWKTLKSKTVYKLGFTSIIENTCKNKNGEVFKHLTIKRPDVCVMAAFTPKMEMILEYQYRHPVNSTHFELPAGHMEWHEKNPKKAMLRELFEETGYKAKKLIKIHTSFSLAGTMSGKVHYFIGFDCTKISDAEPEKDEEIEIKLMSFKKAQKLFEQNKIENLTSIACFLLTREYLKKNHKLT